LTLSTCSASSGAPALSGWRAVKRLYFDHWLALIWPGTGGKAKLTSALPRGER